MARKGKDRKAKGKAAPAEDLDGDEAPIDAEEEESFDAEDEEVDEEAADGDEEAQEEEEEAPDRKSRRKEKPAKAPKASDPYRPKRLWWESGMMILAALCTLSAGALFAYDSFQRYGVTFQVFNAGDQAPYLPLAVTVVAARDVVMVSQDEAAPSNDKTLYIASGRRMGDDTGEKARIPLVVLEAGAHDGIALGQIWEVQIGNRTADIEIVDVHDTISVGRVIGAGADQIPVNAQTPTTVHFVSQQAKASGSD